mmetsp:Transcript_38328/g.55993  ORF Transcript_38328/g.55993 Transcript_38328/m.55993 type:complete len:91 (+) Transcript_38328:212-484(+)
MIFLKFHWCVFQKMKIAIKSFLWSRKEKIYCCTPVHILQCMHALIQDSFFDHDDYFGLAVPAAVVAALAHFVEQNLTPNFSKPISSIIPF